ncbi:PAS domain S-box protein [bacterium]|nr:PAS domain S-box protein [bacterium]
MELRSLGLLVLEAFLGFSLTLGVHAMRRRFGLAPFYAYIGYTAVLAWMVCATGLTVRFGDLSFLVGSAVLFTFVLIGFLVVYILDGPHAGRMVILTWVVVSFLLHAMNYGINYHLEVNGQPQIELLTQPGLRMFAASLVALIFDTIVLSICWELLNRINKQLPLIGQTFIALLCVMWVDVIVFVPIAFLGKPEFAAVLDGNLVGRLAIAAFTAPIIWGYFLYERRRYGTVLESRPVLAIFQRENLVLELEDARRIARVGEQALRESEERFAKAFRFSPLLIAVIDLANDRFIDVNEQFTTELGFTRAEAVGHTPVELGILTLESRQELEARLRERGVLCDFEVVTHAKSGEAFCFRLHGVVLTVTGKNRLLIIGENITDRKLAQEALRESKERYRSVFETTNDAIMILADGRFIDCNPHTLELFGRTRDEIIGHTPSELSPEFQRDGRASDEKARTLVDATLAGNPQFFEWQHHRPDGSLFDVEITLSCYQLSGQSLIVCGLRDVTERVRAQIEKSRLEAQLQQKQKIEAIGTLAGGIAHDFNNILFAILGYADLALEATPPEAQSRELIEGILTAGNRAADLVKQILAFSRKAETKKMPLVLGPIVKETLKLLRSTTPANIEIRENLPAADRRVLGNPTEIHQVLLNLCNNANYAMRESGGLLEISLLEFQVTEESIELDGQLQPGSYVLLKVTDTGQGIPPERIEQIFDPFYTTKDPGEGTGLGLSVVHGIVTAMGGAVSVYSDPGKGTVFNVFLPRTGELAVDEQLPSTEIPLGCEQIMLVEDERAVARVEEMMLSNLGYHVSLFLDSTEALAAFRLAPAEYDLVITDLAMPQLPGDKLSAEILAIRPDVPIILCTGFAHHLTPEDIKAIGIRMCLTKPIAKQDLAVSVRSILA